MKFRQAIYSSSEVVNEPLLVELGQKAREQLLLTGLSGTAPELDRTLRRSSPLELPELSELRVIRHYTRLSQMNYGVDCGTYPLGSCTMKYNPKLNDLIAQFPGFADIHPGQSPETVQGALEVLWSLESLLREITGLDAVSLQPAAGSQGEFTGMLITKAYFRDKGELGHRKQVLIPDTAHGSNFASAAMAGFEVVKVPSHDGETDIGSLESLLSDRVAAFMVTVPNTLGIFERNVKHICELVHDAGGLMYFDGANMNALNGVARPGDFGFDIAHLNLHKAFSTPHGGGGPGAGPVAVRSDLEGYLPGPRVKKGPDGTYSLEDGSEKSVGRVREGLGNFGVLLRAYFYIRALGGEGLRQATRDAVLTTNYAAKRVSQRLALPFGRDKRRKHEFVASARGSGKRALDIAKGVLGSGHAPTIYFPQIVEEALMIEFTESETKAEVDDYIDGLLGTLDRDLSLEPSTTSVARLDEADAARNPRLTWREVVEKKEKQAS